MSGLVGNSLFPEEVRLQKNRHEPTKQPVNMFLSDACIPTIIVSHYYMNYLSLAPCATVHVAIAHSLGYVTALNTVAAFKVGYGAGNTEDAVIGAG